jgi:hypothetical protein
VTDCYRAFFGRAEFILPRCAMPMPVQVDPEIKKAAAIIRGGDSLPGH